MEDEAFLDARAAAELLGVSRATLYAYVSRGLLVSEPGYAGGRRANRYPRTALEQLVRSRERRHDPQLQALGALGTGMPVLDSQLTLIADGRLWYRGHDACGLARTTTLEAVASLLWVGTLDAGESIFGGLAPAGSAPAAGSLADRLVRCLVEERSRPPVTLAEPSLPALRSAAQTLLALFAAVGAAGEGTLAERLARGLGAADPALLDCALILCADHELNTSSFTARCVASTDAPVHTILLAALCALEGRRHGGASELVADLLLAAERDGPRRAWRRALTTQGRAPGFGMPANLYPDGDPRARELLERLAVPGEGVVAALLALAREELGIGPNIDFALAALAHQEALPPGSAFALFALGRSVGWIAHAFEAAADGRLIRPRARYTGPAPADRS